MDRSWTRERLSRALGDWGNSNDNAVFRQLAERLRHLIHTGDIPSGVRLPSERAIASALGVSRTTVVAALDQLRSEGLIVSRQGAGTYVTKAGWHLEARGDSRLDTFLVSTPIAGQIDLRSAALPGLPLVAEEIQRLGSIDIKDLVSSHGYLPSGIPELREAIAQYYTNLGLATDSNQVLITSGAQQALRLVSTAVLETAAPVLVEEPTFRGAIETLRSLGARLHPVPSGAGGVDLAALKDAVHRVRPAMLFIQSGGHNPTGAVMSQASRSSVARIAGESGTLVVEDAAVTDAVIDGEPLPPIHGFGARVVTIGSASKSFWGGLRVGWLRSDPDIIHHLTVVKGAEDLGTSLLAQMVTAKLMPKIDEARSQRRHALLRARSMLIDALQEALPTWVPLIPHAGGSLWVRIPSAEATALVQQAERHGVSVLAGPTFSCIDQLDDHLRISFAGPPEAIVQGVVRLAQTWRQN